MTMPIIRAAHSRRYPPRVTAFTRPFWDALADGRFTVTHCRQCEKNSFPPKPVCPSCWSEDIVWRDIDPRGELYSWTRVHAGPAIFDDDLPLAVGIVDLDAGIRVACPLTGDAVDWQCGMPVEIVTCVFDDGPFFAGAPSGAFPREV